VTELPVITVRATGATSADEENPSYSVHINGLDVSKYCTRVEVDLEAGEFPEVCLTYAAGAVNLMSTAAVTTLFDATAASRDATRNPDEHRAFSSEHAQALAAAVVRSVESVTCHCRHCQDDEEPRP
jgi:hypothetical protein